MAAAIPIIAKFAPAILGSLGSLFGRKKKNENMIPEWFRPYLESMQQNAGRYGGLIDEIDARDPIRKGLNQEAQAAMGKGKYAAQGYGPIAAAVLESLRAKQATAAKANTRQTQMNYAASGVGTGLLPAVLAQQESEREQSNALANSEAQSNVALGSINSYTNLINTQRDQKARLAGQEGAAFGNIANLAGSIGERETDRSSSQPGILSQILGGIGAAAPGILSGLKNPSGESTGDAGGQQSTVDDVKRAAQSLTSENYPSLSHIPQPRTMEDTSPSAPLSTIPVPQSMDDWWKYYSGKRK